MSDIDIDALGMAVQEADDSFAWDDRSPGLPTRWRNHIATAVLDALDLPGRERALREQIARGVGARTQNPPTQVISRAARLAWRQGVNDALRIIRDGGHDGE